MVSQVANYQPNFFDKSSMYLNKNLIRPNGQQPSIDMIHLYKNLKYLDGNFMCSNKNPTCLKGCSCTDQRQMVVVVGRGTIIRKEANKDGHVRGQWGGVEGFVETRKGRWTIGKKRL